MAASIALPAGFEIDSAPASNGLPAGFEVDAPAVAKSSPTVGSRAEDIASGANRFFTTVLPGLPVDTVTNIVDLLKAGVGTAYHETTGQPIPSALELTDRTKIPLSSANIQTNLDKYAPSLGENNYPVNNDKTGRVLANVGMGGAAALTGGAAGGGSIANAGNNAALSVLPSAAQQLTAEKYPDSPLAQLAASIGTAALQGGVRYGAPELTKRMLRGGEAGRQSAADTIATFDRAGTTPTVGQATGSRTYQAAENMLARVPGGAGPVISKAEDLQASLGKKVNEIADNLSPSATPEQAGRAIYKGITGDHAKNPQESFIPRARAVQQALYQKLDQHIDAAADISISHTLSAIKRMTAAIPGAPNLSETPLMNNSTLKALNEAISADVGDVPGTYINDPRGGRTYTTLPIGEDKTVGSYVPDPRGGRTYTTVPDNSAGDGMSIGNPPKELPTGDQVSYNRPLYVEKTVPANGENVSYNRKIYIPPGGAPNDGVRSFYDAKDSLPYKAIKEMRTRIGEKLSAVDLAPDVSKTELKQLYGALSQDMESAAKAAGPQAYAAFKRANGYTAAMHDRIDLLQSIIDKNGGPEKIFTAATSGTKDGATVLRTVMRSLPYDSKKMLSASILTRMGKALPGQQDATGDVFSTNRFLTQWNTMSPEAKQAAFGGYSPEFSKNMDAIALVASNLREGSKVFANPSGTAQAVSQQTVALGILGALATGHPATAALGVGGIASANLAARALTNPGVVKWMAKATKVPSNQLDAQIRLLALTGARNKDQDMIDVADALKEQGDTVQQQR